MSKRRHRRINSVIDFRRAPDPENKPPCWLVWSLQSNGLTQLRAIDTSPRIAQRHRKGCLNEMAPGNITCIKAWIELRDMNHFYGHEDITQHIITNRKELQKLAEELK